MTQLMENAIRKLQSLPPEEQDAVASRILDEFDQDEAWETRFQETSQEQWQKLAAMARAEMAAGELVPLEEFLAMDGGEQ